MHATSSLVSGARLRAAVSRAMCPKLRKKVAQRSSPASSGCFRLKLERKFLPEKKTTTHLRLEWKQHVDDDGRLGDENEL